MAKQLTLAELDKELTRIEAALNNAFQSGQWEAVVVNRKPKDLGHMVVYEIRMKGVPESLHSIVLSMLPGPAHEVAEGLNALDQIKESFD